MSEPNLRETFRKALDLLTGDGPEEDAEKAGDLFLSLSPDQLEHLSESVQILLTGIEMTRQIKLRQLAGRN